MLPENILSKITVPKATKEMPLGIEFQEDDNGMVVVASVAPSSPFLDLIDVGVPVVAVEGIPMSGKGSADASNLLKEAEGEVSVIFVKVPPMIPAETEGASTSDPEIEPDIDLGEDEIEILDADSENENDLHQLSQYVTVMADAPVAGETPTTATEAQPAVAVEVDVETTPVDPSEVVSPPPQDLVSVVAPEDLPEGYQLQVEVEGQPMVVTIPEGGVKKGQVIMAPIMLPDALPVMAPSTVQQEGGDDQKPSTAATKPLMEVPKGKWRDGFSNCCAHCDRSVFWLAWFCSPISLGQIMTRMGLNWVGEPEEHVDTSAFYFLAIAFAVVCIFFFIFVFLAGGVAWLVFLSFFIFFLVMMIKTRMHIRKQYAIEGSVLEDCCLSFWCGCFTLIQMSSHTADLEKHDAKCCTQTGLGPTAPPNQHLLTEPRDKAAHEAKLKRRKYIWGGLAGLLLILLIVGSVKAGNNGGGGGGGGGIRGSSSCGYGYKYCYVYKCANEYNGFSGRLEYKCRYKYEYEYVYCDRCP